MISPVIRCCSAITSASRRCFTSAGTVSGILRAAYVPSRSEYANVNALSKRSSSCARSVAAELVLGLVAEADQQVGRDRDAGHGARSFAYSARNVAKS